MRIPQTVLDEMLALGIIEVDETELKKSYNHMGREYPNPKPLEIAMKARKPETLREQVARIMKTDDMIRHLRQEGMETIDEALDLDIDEPDPLSEYQMMSMMDDFPIEKPVLQGLTADPAGKVSGKTGANSEDLESKSGEGQ